MNYRSIAEANLADAEAHLKEAIKMNSKPHIKVAASMLRERIKLIEPLDPELCSLYKELLQGIKVDE